MKQTRNYLTNLSTSMRIIAVIAVIGASLLTFTVAGAKAANYSLVESVTTFFGWQQPAAENKIVSASNDKKTETLDKNNIKDNPSQDLIATTTYAFTSSTGVTLEDMSTGTTQLVGATSDDGNSTLTNIGFEFWYDGSRYTAFGANANGFIKMGAVVGSTAFTNALASTTESPKIAAYWDDIATGSNGKVHSKVVGTAGVDRKLVVEFLNMTIPRATTGTGAGTFQIWLYDSANSTKPGVIQFVYGNGIVANTTNGGASIGIQSGAATNFASVTASTNTVSYTTANDTNTAAITAGRSYLFTPQVPNSPTALTVTNPTSTSLRLNYTDNATNELGFAIYSSTDNTTFTYLGQVGANATTVNITGLIPSTTYFFRVYAVSEGALSSSFASGSGTTNPPVSGTKTIGAGGDYATLASAINDVNGGTGAGGVTFNIAAGTTFAENSTCITGGSVTNPVIFQKSGTGANPIIQPPGSTSTADSGVCILGGDYITFDGIDIVVASGNTAVERGFDIENLTATNGANNNTIKNTSITMNRANTSSIGIFQGDFTPSSAAGTNNNNKYQNLTIQNSAQGILLQGTTAFQDTGNEISTTAPNTFNTIGSPTTANDIGNFASSTIYGIQALNQSGVKISNNEIQNVTSTSTSSSVYGIFLNNSGSNAFSVGTNNINNNKIHDIQLTGASTTGVVYGIREDLTNNAASISNVFNNFIYGLNTTSATTASRKIIGIGSQIIGSGASSTHNINNNSVRIAPTSVTASNTCFEIGTSSPIYKVVNNIFANFTGAQTGNAKHYTWVSTSSTSIGGTGTVSNFNDLYIANTTNGFVGLGSATDYATLANFRTAYGQDANSISADPLFSSATDLHLNSNSPAVNTGTTIAAVTTDIDSQARPNGAVYDIGADEFYASPGVLQFNPTTYTGNEGATVGLVISRTGGSSGSATVDVTLNNGTATGGGACGTGVDFINPGVQTVTLGDTVTSFTLNVTLCTDALLEGGEAFTATLSNPTTATLGANTTATVNITDIAPPFNGNYNVGTGNSFTSLTNTGGLFEAINNSGATGNIVINVTSDLTSETGTVGLNQITGGFTVTIKPSSSPRAISGTSANCLINLNGADNVTIDGSSTGSTTRDLTITNNNGGTSSAVVCMTSTGVGAGATFNIVKNTNIVGNSNITTLFGIYSGGSAISVTGAGADNDSNTIQNNNISKTQYGIFSGGISAANKNTGTVITQNLINTAAPNNVQIGGIYARFEDGVQITQNDVANIVTATSVTPAFGISLGLRNSNTYTDFTGSEVVGATVSRNRIDNVVRTGDGSAFGIGIATVTTAGAAANTVVNNMVSGVRSTGATPSDFPAGILLGGGATGSTNVYFNSVSMTGVCSSSSPCYGVAIGGSNPVVDLRNNIIYNAQTSSTGKIYAIGLAYSTYTNLTSDYNDFFVSGTNTFIGQTGGLGTAGTDRATLANWRTATGKDTNSKSVDPMFVSTTDLHLSATSTLFGMGTPITGITTDFDGVTRPVIPDIGADEVIQNGTLALSSTTYSVAENGGPATVTVNRTGGFDGTASVNYALTDGTATGGACGAGIDFDNTGGTVSFADGQATKTFTVAICDDAVFEGDEIFTVTLSDATGATLGTQASATVTITENDAAPMISIGNATANEADGTISFTVTQSGTTSAVNTTFTYSTADVTATDGSDYTGTQIGSGTIAAGSSSTTIIIPVLNDTVFENTETFTVTLGNTPVNATIGSGQATGTITDNDTAPSFTIDDVTHNEGNAGTTSYTFTITKTGSTAVNASVDYATVNSTAAAPSDFTAIPTTTVTFAPNEPTKQVTVLVNGDTTFEADEAFTVHLSNQSGAIITDADGTGTIVNDDTAPVLSVDDVTFTGNSVIGFGFTVTKTGATELPVTVHYATMDGTAIAGQDYTAASGTLTFAAGETTKQIPITILGDTIVEPTEQFFVDLDTPTNSTIGDGHGVGTISNDDLTFSIDDVTLLEGDSGTTAYVFTVTKNGSNGLASTVNFATVDGTATVANNDYATNSGTLNFGAGEATKQITVLVNGDVTTEPDEAFTVHLTSPTGNATISDADGTGTIQNDDCAAPPTNLIGWYPGENNTNDIIGTNEGTNNNTIFAPGKVNQALSFNGLNSQVVLPSRPVQDDFTIQFWMKSAQTGGGDSQWYNGFGLIDGEVGGATNDFGISLGNGKVLFGVGNTDTTIRSGTINNNAWHHVAATRNRTTGAIVLYVDGVQVAAGTGGTQSLTAPQRLVLGSLQTNGNYYNGLLDEVQIFNRTLSAQEVADSFAASGAGTCHVSTLQLDSATYSVGEAETTKTITVTRTGAHDTGATVQYATSAGTATSGTDYDDVNGTLTFNAGDVSKTFGIPVHDDAVFEGSETVNVQLSTAAGTGVTLGTPSGAVLTIVDNEGQPSLSVDDVTFTGADSVIASGFTVTLSGAAQAPVTVHYATTDGSATAGQDYTAASGTLTFVPGDTTEFIPITILGDIILEPVETFAVNLDTPTNAIIADAQGIGTIPNDDAAPTISIGDVSLSEGNAGTIAFTFNVTLQYAINQTVTVSYATADGTATAPSDYAAASGTVTFAPNQTTQQITVLVNGDQIGEPNEQFSVNLSNASANASIADNQGIGTILDDENAAFGIEADVVNRPTGDGVVALEDMMKIGDFIAGIETPDSLNNNEFQRADSEPAATKGDGNLDLGDLIQAGIYTVQGDPLQTAGGPTQPNPTTELIDKNDLLIQRLRGKSVKTHDVRVVSKSAAPGTGVVVPIELESDGTESAMSFTLNYDAAILGNPRVALGTGAEGALLIQNTNNAGQIGVVLAYFGDRRFEPGVKQVITVGFDVAANAEFGATPLTIGRTPVANQVRSGRTLIPANFAGGSVNIASPTAASVEIGGRAMTADGRGLRNVRVSLTDASGATRTALTGPFGNYRFPDVSAGQTVIVSIFSKRYNFENATRAISVTEEINDLNFISPQ